MKPSTFVAWILSLIIAYPVLSGPAGGLICLLLRASVDRSTGFPHYTLGTFYLWHLQFYGPLFSLATCLGVDNALFAYWQLFGWEFIMFA